MLRTRSGSGGRRRWRRLCSTGVDSRVSHRLDAPRWRRACSAFRRRSSILRAARSSSRRAASATRAAAVPGLSLRSARTGDLCTNQPVSLGDSAVAETRRDDLIYALQETRTGAAASMPARSAAGPPVAARARQSGVLVLPAARRRLFPSAYERSAASSPLFSAS